MENMERHQGWLVEMGRRLRNERERQGLSRVALAEVTNTDQSYIVQIERGARSPSLRLLKNLLMALNISADHIFFGTVSEKNKETGAILSDIVNLLERKDDKEIVILYDIIRTVIRYREL